MRSSKGKKQASFGTVPFVLDAADVATATTMGLLRPEVSIQRSDLTQGDYGVAYERRNNIGTEVHGSQKAIQARCKEFALACGFQLKVQGYSSKPNGSGNAKYVCKNLNGQQFFDKDSLDDEISCPFFFNVSGSDGRWKVTQTNLCHNHVKHVGFSGRPVAEGSVARPAKDKRNTTQRVDTLASLVESEMLPQYEGKTDKITGAAMLDFLTGLGYKLGRSTISRIKSSIDERAHGDRHRSYQKLESYLTLMAEKNPGSIWRFEKESDGTFKRACFIPSIGVRVVKMSRKLYGFDGAHLKGEMNNYGVYLVGTAKDFNNHILPFAFSLVPVENHDHWVWFLAVVKEALGEHERFTIVSDRQKGLLSAVESVFPHAGHRFCLRHIKSNINRTGCSLTDKERRIINNMARSDCESDYKLFESELAQTKQRAVDYLNGIDKKHWVKYKYQESFKLPTYDETTSNLAEQANNWIGNDCRSAKPLDALGLYFRKLSELVSDKRQMAAHWLVKSPSTDLVPLLANERKRLILGSNQCKLTPCMEGAYNVMYLGPTTREGYVHPWRLVDLPARECTCGNWQDTEFPCIHAISAAVLEGQPLETLYNWNRMSIAHFKDTYSAPFRPWPTDITLEDDPSIRMPLIPSEPPEQGKRGLKPGPKPKHKRKKARGGD